MPLALLGLLDEAAHVATAWLAAEALHLPESAGARLGLLAGAYLERRIAHDHQRMVGRGDLFGQRVRPHNHGCARVNRAGALPLIHFPHRVHPFLS